MRPTLRRLLVAAAQTDQIAKLQEGIWTTRCLHCRTRLQLREDGSPLGHTSLEHVIAQAWFGKRTAMALTAQVNDDANDPRNLALACRSCNQNKGKGPDADGPSNPRAYEIVSRLLQTRLARWRDFY